MYQFFSVINTKLKNYVQRLLEFENIYEWHKHTLIFHLMIINEKPCLNGGKMGKEVGQI